MSLCRNLILVISHLFAPFFLVRKNLSSFGFYKSHIKTFWFGMWAIFVQDGPRLPASTSQALVRECSHILLRTDSCIFLLFSRNVGTHALYNNLFRNCSLLSSPPFLPFLFAFCTAAYLHHSGVLTRTAATSAYRMGL